ncbi:MAG TPA: c-type cytochrome domain-containing protein [candidate division Zixibacteria bacterium]|nr:c-type cytochrome domain-containing protein [candidate division Zixibacteria bacterium]
MNSVQRQCMIVVSLLALGLGASACSDSGSPTGGGGNNNPPAALTWNDYVGPLFQQNCGSSTCHGSTPGQSGFSILTYASALAGGNSGSGIVPNDTAASIVYQRLTGAIMPRMPQGGPYFSAARLDSIATWIMSGAPEM